LVGYTVGAAHRSERFRERLARGAYRIQNLSRLRPAHGGEPHEEMLGGDVFVLELTRLGLGGVEHLIQLAGYGRLYAPRLSRIALYHTLHAGRDVRDVRADLVQEGDDDPFLLAEEREEKVA